MSRYLFGLHLDGASPPSAYQGLQSSICGPETFLSALEASLGLQPTDQNPLQRTLAYRDLIAATLADDAFYARSFRCDPLATARLLLLWRDSLTEAGWHAELDHSDAPPRLQALADLESVFNDTGLAGASHAGRIAAILAELVSGSKLAIDSLVVTDLPETLQLCWLKLFDVLNAEYDGLIPSKALADPATALGSVQAKFLDQNTDAPGAPDSLRIITASTAEAAADALASQLANLDPATTTLIADPAEREALNRHLEHLDLPLSTSKTETGAALLELPSLVIRCRIAPLNPQAWIEFLLHPISPVPSRLRNRLAETIHNLPGHGPHWGETLENCIAQIDAADTDAIAKLRQVYVDWIDAPLIAADALTGPDLADTISVLGKWLTSRAGAKKSDDANDASEWVIASRAVAQLESILSSEAALTWIEVNRLLAEWYQSAATTTRFPGQVGSVTAIASPDQLLATQDQIIWWRPSPTHTRRSPWTRAESDWLTSHNVVLLDETKIALAAETTAARAVLFAGKSLTIYQVTQSEGNPTGQAGILTRLLSLCGHSIIVPARGLTTTEAIPLRPLPPLRRWWNLETPDLLPAREYESFSSVSKVIDAPVDWVLEKKAKLSAGSISSFRASDSALRSGSVLHAAAEELFDHPEITWQTASESALNQCIADLFPGLLSSKAALYLTPGYEAARTRLLHSAQQSLWHLVEILREAGVTEVTLEQSIDAVPFVGGQIGGRIDLIARCADGKTAVIDLKLGGKTKRREELQNNRQLQLATYGHLMRESEGIEPSTAFFILSNGGALLTRNESFFPNTDPITPKGDSPSSDWQTCWQEFEEIYRWRRSQLDQGCIEVPVPGTEADDPPPIDRWAPPKDGNPYSSFKNLTGHPSNA